MSGFSEPLLSCPNTPTGSKEKNGYLMNPSPISLFFEGDEVGYSNGQVMIDYDSNSDTNKTGDLSISGELGFSKSTGKTSVVVKPNVSKYNQKDRVIIKLFAPIGIELKSKNCFGSSARLGSGDSYYEKGFECSFDKEFLINNNVVFDIDKLPANYDPNKPETHPKVMMEISSANLMEENIINNRETLIIGPL